MIAQRLPSGEVSQDEAEKERYELIVGPHPTIPIEQGLKALLFGM
jgi:hypothetical protein